LYKRELRGRNVDDKTEPHLLCERATMLGLALHIDERIARHEEVRGHYVTGVRRISEIADPGCGVERAAKQITAGLDMFRPRHETSEVQVGPGLEAPQPSLLHQFIAKLGESKSGVVVAEARAGDRA